MTVVERALPRRAVTSSVAAAVLALGACSSSRQEEPPASPTPPEQTAPTTEPPTSTEPPTTPPPTEDPAPTLTEAGVSAGHPAAVEAGVEVLAAGGNAVDAAVATAFAVSVVEPFASGIGGGGAALVVPTDPEEPPLAYDYREVVAGDGVIPPTGTGIPGFVAGMAELHDEHGELPWAEVLAPAIELAEDGHPASAMLAEQLRVGHGSNVIARNPQFASGGQPLGTGDLLVQPELAATLATLAAEGADAFYTGQISAELVGVDGIDAESLAGYEVMRGEPAGGSVGDYELLAAMPPLPGAALVQQLQVAEALGAGELEPGSAEFLHVMASAWSVADETVNTVIGDPAFVDVPVAELTDPERNASIAADLPAASVVTTASAAGAVPPAEPGNTTHISVVDSEGLAVSMTNTITIFWGSGESVGGFFLNDQLSRFDAVGTTQANTPAPGRRSVSWAVPAVLADADGRPVLVLGTPGGRQIPNILSGVIMRWALHGETLADAVAAGRAHAEGSTLRVETMPSQEVVDALAGYGYTPEVVAPEVRLFGSVQALEIDHDEGTVTGAQDDRREGTFTIVEE